MIRHATVNDTPKLLPLLSELGYPAALEDLNKRFIKFLSNSGYGVAVCETNNEIIELIVSPIHRDTSIGKKLMAFVEDIAQQCFPAIIDLISGLRRIWSGTHEFYKRIGYKNGGHMAKLYLRKEL